MLRCFRVFFLDNTSYKVYTSYQDRNSDYVDVNVTYNDRDGYLGVGIHWDEYEDAIGGLFSNRYYRINFYPLGEKLHINGKNQNGA